MKKVLIGAIVGLLAGIGIYAYSHKRAEDANDVDVVIDVDTINQTRENLVNKEN